MLHYGHVSNFWNVQCAPYTLHMTVYCTLWLTWLTVESKVSNYTFIHVIYTYILEYSAIILSEDWTNKEDASLYFIVLIICDISINLPRMYIKIRGNVFFTELCQGVMCVHMHTWARACATDCDMTAYKTMMKFQPTQESCRPTQEPK